MKTNHRTQLYLDELHYQYLLHRSQNERKSMASVVREILDKLIYSESKKTSDSIYKLIGLGGSGKRDIALNHDSYIYNKD